MVRRGGATLQSPATRFRWFDLARADPGARAAPRNEQVRRLCPDPGEDGAPVCSGERPRRQFRIEYVHDDVHLPLRKVNMGWCMVAVVDHYLHAGHARNRRHVRPQGFGPARTRGPTGGVGALCVGQARRACSATLCTSSSVVSGHVATHSTYAKLQQALPARAVHSPK